MKNIILLIIFFNQSFVYSQRINWTYLKPIKVGNYYGFVNYKNESLTENIFDSIKFIKRPEFNNELYAIYKNGKIGLINAYEKMDTTEKLKDFFYVVEPMFDSIQLSPHFWNCYLNNKIAVIDMYNNELFAPSKVSIVCYVYIRIHDYKKYSKKNINEWGPDRKNEKLQERIQKKNDDLVKKDSSYADSKNSLILFGTKYFLIEYKNIYTYPTIFTKREVKISKYLQKVIDNDKDKSRFLGKNITKI